MAQLYRTSCSDTALHRNGCLLELRSSHVGFASSQHTHHSRTSEIAEFHSPVMATTTSTITPGSSHRNAGQTGSQASSVTPVGQHHDLQQANASSTASALQSPPSRVSRPASPSSRTSVSSASNLPTDPIVRVDSTRFRRYWGIVQTFVAWVAIAFTIASFVRDYLDITKDRDPSPQESWQLQNDFRLSCEYDRRAGLQSDACDVVLSEPASPPPGIAKRALHERGVPHHLELAYKIPYASMALMVIATIVLPFAIDKSCGQSREEQPVICWSKPSSTSIGEQPEVHTDPSDSPSNQLSRENERLERPGPPSRDKNVWTIIIYALSVSPIFLIYWVS